MPRNISEFDNEELTRTLLEALDNAGFGITVVLEKNAHEPLLRLYSNVSNARLLGFERVEDASEIDAMDSLIPSERERIQREREKVEEGSPRLTHLDTVLQQPSGKQVPVSIDLAAVPYMDGWATVGVLQDLTERQKLQAELAQVDRMATIGMFAAGLAHEINNPLTYVLLHLARVQSRLERGVVNESEVAGLLRLVREAVEGGERVRSIIRDLLVYAKNEPLSPEPIDLRQLIQSSVKLAHVSFRDCASVKVSMDDAPSWVEGRRSRIGQVIVNLLTNAAQAYEDDDPEKNLIWLTLRRAPLVQGMIEISVEDHGPGLPEARRQRLFTPFHTTKDMGNGLGLTVTRAIVESMGGTIAVEAAEPTGVRFVIHLPLREITPPFGHDATPVTGPTDRRIVIIDDEKPLIRAMELTLRESYQVEVFGSGASGLRRLSSQPYPDLVICDFLLPEMTGEDLFRAVCQANPYYRNRFIFMTGARLTEQQLDQNGWKHSDMLLKPFNEQDLLQSIQSRLAQVGPDYSTKI